MSDDLRRVVVESYSSDEKVAYYAARAVEGLRRWEQSVIWAHLASPGSALVVGCGAGREAFALEALGWSVTGVDVAEPLLASARTRGGGVRFLLTDGSLDDVDISSVDTATLWAQVLNSVPGDAARRRLLGNVHRLVRPGGLISLSVHDRALTMAEIEASTLVSVDVPEPGDVLLRGDGGLRESYNHYFTEAELRSLLDDTGFVDVEVLHTDDLGEAWGNVFVAVARRPASADVADGGGPGQT